MTLASNTSYGCFLVVEEFIVGWLTKTHVHYLAGKEAALLSTYPSCTQILNQAEESPSTRID